MLGKGIGARFQGRVTIGKAGAAFIKANETAGVTEAMRAPFFLHSTFCLSLDLLDS
jgi:hypothetical protein